MDRRRLKVISTEHTMNFPDYGFKTGNQNEILPKFVLMKLISCI
jgi:hypothetical protein